MLVLKALAVGFGIVLSLVIVTFVYVYLQAAPKEKGLCARIWRNVHSTRVSEKHLFPPAGRPNDTFSPEWPINWGLAVEMTLRERDDGRSAETVLLALGAWKPAKDTGFHIPTATATAALKSNKLLNPRKSHDFPDSCAEPEKATGMIVVLASPYYWILAILVVVLEAWLLMRHRAG